MEKQMVENVSTAVASIATKFYASTGINNSSKLGKVMLANANALGYAFDKNDNHVERIADAFFTAVATFLNETKPTKADEATALIVQDVEGGFKFAALVEYVADEMKWNYSTTFREEDLQDLKKKKNVKDFCVDNHAFQHIFNTVSYDIGGFVFAEPSYLIDACRVVVDSINQVVEGNSETVIASAYLIAMLDPFKAAINDLTALGKDLKAQSKIREARMCFLFSGCMLGVHLVAIETQTYAAYPNEMLPSEIDNIDLVCRQVNRCSTIQKEYGLHPEQGMTVNYEQILHDLEALKDLVKAEQPNPAAMLNIAVELIRATLQADIQLMNDLIPELKDYVPEEETKSESVNEK